MSYQNLFRQSERLTKIGDRGHEQHEVEHTVDMIDDLSNLPDCILHHILSFMPTKEVVKTSILSTRWKNLWASVPNIDFEDECLNFSDVDGLSPSQVTSFMDFVERVLRLRDASYMEKFRLSCCVYNESQIQSWISDAIIHNVQELDLCFIQGSFVIPLSVFHSTSLVTLKIEMFSELELPSYISFPCLKTLHLSQVIFLNNDSTEKLFSSSPVLEELVLSECEWLNLTNVVISSATLKSLIIDDVSFFGSWDDPIGRKIKINAANLAYLEYSGYILNEIFLNNVSSLVKAWIRIDIPRETQKQVACQGLLKQLRNILSLRIANCTIESHMIADNMLVRFPVFAKLSHLVLTTEIKNSTVGALMDLLCCCPVLQSICLSEGFERYMRLDLDDLIRLSIPTCISHCLKTLTFGNFRADDSEICFLKSILKYAHVLERMDIRWRGRSLEVIKRKRDVRRELEMTARSSAACVIKFW